MDRRSERIGRTESFGGAERLSLEGSLFYLTENGGHPDRDEDLRWNDLEAASGRAFSSPLSGNPQ